MLITYVAILYMHVYYPLGCFNSQTQSWAVMESIYHEYQICCLQNTRIKVVHCQNDIWTSLNPEDDNIAARHFHVWIKCILNYM